MAQEHPYNSKYHILLEAFKALEEEQRKKWWTVVGYFGDFKLLQYENDQITKAKAYFLKLYEEKLLSEQKTGLSAEILLVDEQ